MNKKYQNKRRKIQSFILVHCLFLEKLIQLSNHNLNQISTMHQESLQAITTNLQFTPRKKILRHSTLGSFLNISLRKPYSQPKLENPILACCKQFTHKNKDCVNIIHKKNQVEEIQLDKSFHKNLSGLRRRSSSTQQTQLTFKKRSS